MNEIAKQQKNSWRKVKLGEIAEFVKGKKPNCLFYKKTSENFLEYILLGDEKIYAKPESSLVRVFSTDIIIVADGASSGTIFTGKNGFLGSTFLRIRTKSKYEKEINSNFLYFYLKYSENVFKSVLTGSAIPHIDQENLRNFEILIPENITKQQYIASILSAFDDKIEVNNKISKNLEEMAQAIFKEWFVKFRFLGHKKAKMIDSELGKIPKGWEIKMLPEVFDFLEGPGIRNWQYTTSGCRFINIRLIQNNDIDIKSANFISDEEANGKYKYFHLQERDMVVSTSGTLGRSAIVRKEHLPLLLNTSVIRFRPKDERNYAFMYQFLNSAYFQNKVLSMASGSAQSNFGPVHLKQIEMFVPDKETLDVFNNAVNPIYEKIIVNMLENQKLAVLRDLFLPKLINGEIRV
jgi:type I restriction enzyme, S subunit